MQDRMPGSDLLMQVQSISNAKTRRHLLALSNGWLSGVWFVLIYAADATALTLNIGDGAPAFWVVE